MPAGRREPAGHLQRRRRVVARARRRMEADRELRGNQRDVLELEQEVALPGAAVELAVGDDAEPDPFLQAHHVADRILLDAPELGRRERALLRRFSRGDQGIGTDQAADMVGAKRRRGSFSHGPMHISIEFSQVAEGTRRRYGRAITTYPSAENKA